MQFQRFCRRLCLPAEFTIFDHGVFHSVKAAVLEHGDHVLDALPAAAEPGACNEPGWGAFARLLRIEPVGQRIQLGPNRGLEPSSLKVATIARRGISSRISDAADLLLIEW